MITRLALSVVSTTQFNLAKSKFRAALSCCFNMLSLKGKLPEPARKPQCFLQSQETMLIIYLYLKDFQIKFQIVVQITSKSGKTASFYLDLSAYQSQHCKNNIL